LSTELVTFGENTSITTGWESILCGDLSGQSQTRN